MCTINLLVEPIIEYEKSVIKQKSDTITNIIKRDFTILINAKNLLSKLSKTKLQGTLVKRELTSREKITWSSSKLIFFNFSLSSKLLFICDFGSLTLFFNSSLTNFAKKLKIVNSVSLEFHFGRNM